MNSSNSSEEFFNGTDDYDDSTPILAALWFSESVDLILHAMNYFNCQATTFAKTEPSKKLEATTYINLLIVNAAVYHSLENRIGVIYSTIWFCLKFSVGTDHHHGIPLNFSVFAMFIKYRKEMTSRTTWLMMSLALTFAHEWPFGDTGCVVYAYIMYMTGCADIGHLVVISVDRLLAITSPIKYRSWGNKPILNIVAVIVPWVFGNFWAVLPLFAIKYASISYYILGLLRFAKVYL
ncbi:ninaE [Bugula neritina]|uniref:NinaE n=1 Tax=Bugula neritina TaxID=10212 RepID=A0A7J7KQL2_BUGNE|nr:ninaE [Bugula neritina]